MIKKNIITNIKINCLLIEYLELFSLYYILLIQKLIIKFMFVIIHILFLLAKKVFDRRFPKNKNAKKTNTINKKISHYLS